MRNTSKLQASLVEIESLLSGESLLEADCGSCCGQADTLIVDNNHDLNVYTTAREDGTKNSCCGKPSPSNCNKKDEALANELGASPSNSNEVDFNKWAGNVPGLQASPMFVVLTHR